MPLSSPWVVYMLRCVDGTFYIGISTDLARRMDAHNKGKGAKYTRGRGPVVCVWHEEVATESLARIREAALKRLTRAEKLAFIAK